VANTQSVTHTREIHREATVGRLLETATRTADLVLLATTVVWRIVQCAQGIGAVQESTWLGMKGFSFIRRNIHRLVGEVDIPFWEGVQ